ASGLAFDSVACEATLSGNTVTVSRLTADGAGPGLTLAGTIDIVRGGLGLGGVRSLPVPGPARRHAVGALELGGTLLQPRAKVAPLPQP
ncbi:hypothetical protein J8J17_22620, partial [Mycobacterium tuberculosis]|nr:hypothetical protein [Mycobacterium tuberculosis]